MDGRPQQLRVMPARTLTGTHQGVGWAGTTSWMQREAGRPYDLGQQATCF